MILLVTNKRDVTTDFIVLELRRRGQAFERLNTEDLGGMTVRFRPQVSSGWELELPRKLLALREVRAAFYRRPSIPDVAEKLLEPAAREYAIAEWSAVLRSIWNALDTKWLNSPFAILRAEDKPRQLALAVELGFEVPATLVCNDHNAATAFVGAGETIGKPLRHALIERGDTGEVLFTSRLGVLREHDRSAVELAPVIYQREIRKAYDIRVTVIGERVFPVAIHSQNKAETEVDWRSGANMDLIHEPTALPHDVEQKCVALTHALGLRYGAIDLIADLNGRYWFLEINPNGQWAWIERRTGLPLAAAIVDELIAIAG